MKKIKKISDRNKKGWNDFKKLLNEKALKLVFDVKNYTNSPRCQICKKIVDVNFFTNFHLYRDKERTQFISLHSECAFKFKEKKRIKFSAKVNEILKSSFDFIVKFRKENFLNRFYAKIREKKTKN